MASSSSRSQRTTGGGSARSATGRPGASAKKTASATARSTKPGSPAKSVTGGSAGKNRKRKLINYPRPNKGKIHRWIPSWRVVVGAMLSGIALVCGVVIAAYVTMEMPDASDLAVAQKSVVYYADGSTELASYAEQNRVILPLGEIPVGVMNAFVAAEDRSFYENSGIDPKGLARAAIGNVKALLFGGRITGGSTITQQYAERYYTSGTTRDYVGKFKEAILAVKIDREKDKDVILTDYLNTIYLGRGASGIEVAATKYFGIPAKDLTISQAAMIAGIVPSPTKWDHRFDPKKTEERWNYVLNGMVEEKFITQAERDAMVFPSDSLIPYEKTDTKSGPQGHLGDMVTRELATLGITEDQLNQDGLTVVTTINKTMQDQAEATMAALPEDKPANLMAALVTINPNTGGYLALYGGPDYVTNQFNTATMAVAQAGSTFKPFTLMAGLQSGKTLYDTFDGNSPKKFGNATITNFDNAKFGNVTLEKATQDSINTAYVELNQEIGPDKTVAAAIAAGIPEKTAGLEGNLSNVLGSASVHTVDIARAYTTFATNGIARTPHIVSLVTGKNKDGSVETRYEAVNNSDKRVFTEANTAELTYALTQVVQKGSGKTAASLDVPIAGKTGSSSDNKSAWFVGYTPQYVTAITLFQVGADGSEESITPFGGYKAVTGATVPVDLWTGYMGKVLEGQPIVEFPARTAVRPTATPSPTEEVLVPTEEPTTEAPVETVLTVPGGLVGQTEANARAVLGAAGLNPSISQRYDKNVAAGIVLSVNPSEGAAVEVGATVAVVVSKGPEPVKPDPTPTPSLTTSSTPTPTPTAAITMPPPPADGAGN